MDDSSSSDDFLSVLPGVQCPTRVFRIENPLPWGMPIASNWGMVMAKSNYCLLTDIDHRFATDQLGQLVHYQWQRKTISRFHRVLVDEEGATVPLKPHPNSFVIHREVFFEIGGYDERFVGNYGHSDMDFLGRARANVEIKTTEFTLTTRASKGNNLSRNLDRNRHLLEKNRLTGRRPLRLTAGIELLWQNSLD